MSGLHSHPTLALTFNELKRLQNPLTRHFGRAMQAASSGVLTHQMVVLTEIVAAGNLAARVSRRADSNGMNVMVALRKGSHVRVAPLLPA